MENDYKAISKTKFGSALKRLPKLDLSPGHDFDSRYSNHQKKLKAMSSEGDPTPEQILASRGRFRPEDPTKEYKSYYERDRGRPFGGKTVGTQIRTWAGYGPTAEEQAHHEYYKKKRERK